MNESRDQAFVKACREVLYRSMMEGRWLPREEIILTAMHSPTDSYHTSFDAEYRGVLQLMRRSRLDHHRGTTTTQQRRLDIARAARKRMEDFPDETARVAIDKVVSGGEAPRFYIKYREASQIFTRHFEKLK